MVCVCSVRHPLAKRADVALETLKSERLVLLAPQKSSFSMVQLQGHLMGERPPSEFYFCESTEAITVLVTAGYGISVLPDFLVPEMPLISRVPLQMSALYHLASTTNRCKTTPCSNTLFNAQGKALPHNTGRPAFSSLWQAKHSVPPCRTGQPGAS